jgi:hypothetical protein
MEEPKEIDFIEMSIIDDGKQLSVRFPKKVVEALDIDPKKDIFVFQLDKKNLQLEGSLEDEKVWKKAYHGK